MLCEYPKLFTMRITDYQRQVIREEAAGVFGDTAVARVFGSRADDNARGGDIDLLIESPEVIPRQRKKSLELVARLQMRLGDQPIDVLVIDPATPRQAVHEQASRTGIRL